MGPSDELVKEYGRRLRGTAENEVGRAAPVEHCLKVAGRGVSLRFAGTALVPVILPALRHLSADLTAPADLTVLLCDTRSTGVEMPSSPWHTAHGAAWALRTERFSTLYLPALDGAWWIDRQDRLAIYWTRDASSVPIAARSSPLLTLWAWWLDESGVQLTHAAAVGGANGAALLVGPGGSGKSTTALGCLRSSLRYLADDYCLVDSAPDPVVHSLYSSGKVDVRDGARFAWLRSAWAEQDVEKALYFLYPTLERRLVSELPLRVILVATVTGRPETTLTPVSAMEALRAVAPSTLLQLRVGIDSTRAMTRLADVARRLPAYRIGLGTAIEQIPETIARLVG
jgi:hypothetical protein